MITMHNLNSFDDCIGKITEFKSDRCCEKIILFNELKKIVERKGGKMCSLDPLNYTTSHDKLYVICQDGHFFELCLNNAKKGRWCPNCHIFIGELIAKCALEHLLDKPFKKVRPIWLKMDNNAHLEIDMYNEEYNLGLEYHGIQHYKFIEYFHKTHDNFIKRVGYDKLKIDLCQKNNTKLIVVSYLIKQEDICKYIYEELIKLGYEIDQTKIDSFDMGNHKDALCKTIQITKIIEQKGGKLISGTVLSKDSILVILCENGHTWTTKAKYIKNDAWCHSCGLVVEDDTKLKISESVKKYNETEEGKQMKKESHEKRSITMKKEKDELRATITHKICGSKNCANKDIPQPVSAFTGKSNAKDGLQTNCKACVNVIKQEWRQKQKMQ